MNALTLEIRQYPLQMVVDWDIWHHDFSPRKTSRYSCTQSQKITKQNQNKTTLKKCQADQSLSDDFWACYATKKVAISVGVVSHLRAQSWTSDSIQTQKQKHHLINLLLLSPAPLPNRMVGKVPSHLSPHPAATPGKGKYPPPSFASSVCLCVGNMRAPQNRRLFVLISWEWDSV